MRYAVTQEGVQALRRLSEELMESTAAMKEAAVGLTAAAEKYSAVLGPHHDELFQIIGNVEVTHTAASEPVEHLSGLLCEMAEAYEELINFDPYAGGDSALAAVGSAAAIGAAAAAVSAVSGGGSEDGQTGYQPVSALRRDMLGKVPANRIAAMDRAFQRAPQSMVSVLNQYADRLGQIEDSGYGYNEAGQKVKNGCYYSPEYCQVKMNEQMDQDEYAEVLPHELSHFLDHQRGWESDRPEFVQAIADDRASMDRETPAGRARFYEMLDDAVSTGAAFDRNISDILSAVFCNDPAVSDRFAREGIPYYSHKDSYWTIKGMREKEIYADCGAIFAGGDRISIHFLERHFGNVAEKFKGFFGL